MSDRTIGIFKGIFGSSVLVTRKHDINIIAIDNHEERINHSNQSCVVLLEIVTDEDLVIG